MARKDKIDWCAIILIITVFLAYISALSATWVWDDFKLIVNNSFIDSWSNFLKIFGHNFFVGDNFRAVYYRPVTMAYFFIVKKIFGITPFGFHFFNIVLHIANAYLVYRLLSLVLKIKKSTAMAISFLFAVHPFQAETVVFVSGASDLLFSFFGLLAFYYLIKRRFTLSFLFAALSAFSKETGIMFIVLFIIYLLLIAKQNKSKITVYAIIAVAYIAARVVVIGNVVAPLPPVLHGSVILTLPRIWVNYIIQLFFPFHLAARYNIEPSRSLNEIPTFLSALAVLSIVYYCIRNRKQKMVTYPAVWFALMFLPVSGIVHIPLLKADHFMYLPSIGVFVIAYFIARQIKIKRSTVRFLFIALSLIFLYTLQGRIHAWSSSENLWKDTIIKEPNFFMGYEDLGIEYVRQKKYVKAIPLLEHAINLNYVSEYAHASLAKAYLELGKDQAAFFELQMALKYEKSFSADNHYYYAKLLLKYGKYREAIPHFINVFSKTHEPDALFALGQAYLFSKQWADAEKIFFKGVNLFPAEARFYYQLGVLYYKRKQLNKSILYFKKAYDAYLPGQAISKAAVLENIRNIQKRIDNEKK